MDLEPLINADKVQVVDMKRYSINPHSIFLELF